MYLAVPAGIYGLWSSSPSRDDGGERALNPALCFRDDVLAVEDVAATVEDEVDVEIPPQVSTEILEAPDDPAA